MALDLFTWREEADAAAKVAAAEAARAAAQRKAAFAPIGTKREREARLQAATVEALRAEVALTQVQQQARP